MKRLASCAVALVAALSLTGHAGQPRSVAEGVYSAGQAARGEQIYKAQCALCHGDAMEGASGPPLFGDGFLSNWSAQPLVALVDKIQKTMPFDLPGTLSRQQSTDLAAHMLAVSSFPPGQTELGEGVLAQIAFPVRTSASRAVVPTGGASLPPPEGNLAELMRAIAFPNSNIIFNLQVKDPGAEPQKKPIALTFDYVAWGATVYTGWLAVDQAAVAITETAPLLLTPGRLCQNGRAVPVDRADWKQFVTDLVNAGKFARTAAKARKFEAFGEVSEKLNDACANCHKVYRDKGGAEGSGTARCQ